MRRTAVEGRNSGRLFGAPDAPRIPGSTDPAAAGPSSRRDPLAWSIAILGLIVAGSSLAWALGLGDPNVTARFTGAGSVPGAVLVALLAIRIRGTTRLDIRTRRAWTIVAIGLVLYMVGGLIHFGAAALPFSSVLSPLGLGLEMATYLLVTIGLILLPTQTRSTDDVVLFSLDIAIVAWSAAMLLWHLVIYPIAQGARADLIAAIGAALFPVGDLAIVFSIAAMVSRGLPRSTRSALSIAGGALLFVFAGDLVAETETLRGGYTPGGISGFFYSVALLGLALAFYAQWRVQDGQQPVVGLTDYARTFPWLPYAAVAVAFFIPAIRDWNSLDMFRQHVWATGLLIGLVVARLWVTARQSANLNAAERERLAAAVDQAAEAILTTDRTGNVTYVNRAFTRITGYQPVDMVGRSPDFLREAASPDRLAEMRAALARGEHWEGRLIQGRRDGGTIELDMAVAPLLDTAGSITGSVEVARDISRERALEAQLAQAQRMEAIGRLAGGIAHDFNNILTAISGFGELAAAQVSTEDPVAADIDQIRKATDRAALLTRSLLAFSRRQVMQAQLIDLNQVLDGLTPMLGRLIGEDVQLVVRLDPKLGLTKADRAHLEQVVANLAVNARDAMPAGGTLTITTANADHDGAYARTHVGASAGPYVTLTVSDTGVGMTPAVMEHAFEPFFTTKEPAKGTGLGLSTALGIVQQSGGFVQVQSTPEVGSVFSVHLPRFDGGSKPDEASQLNDLVIDSKAKILVAEDEEAVRYFVQRVLTGAGYEVTVASHGAEALAIAKSMPGLNLLFTDVVMPGMGGVELAAQLAITHPAVPVIFASGYSDTDALRGAVADGTVPYLPKPFTTDALLSRVREVLDKHAKSDRLD